MVVALIHLEVVLVVDVARVEGQHLAAGVEEEAGLVGMLVAEPVQPRRPVLAAQQHVGGAGAPVAAEDGVAGAGHEHRGAVVRGPRLHGVVVDGDGVHLVEAARERSVLVLLPVPAVDAAVRVHGGEVVAVGVVEMGVVDVGSAAAGQAQVEGPAVRRLDLRVGEEVDAREVAEGVHPGQVDIGGVAAVEGPLGPAPVLVVDLLPQGSGHQVVGVVGPLLRRVRPARVVGQGHGRQSEAGVGAHVPVVQDQPQRIARVRGIVEADLEGDQPEAHLPDDDAVEDALGLLRQDRADLFELGRGAGGVLVDHVAGDGVLGGHLALGVGLPHVAAPGGEAHVEEQVHGLPRVALVAGDLPGEGGALGVADLLALFREARGHGIGPLEHRPPPGGVRLPADAVAKRGKVFRREQQARMGLGRQGLGGGGKSRAGDQECQGGGQGRPRRGSLGNAHGYSRPSNRQGDRVCPGGRTCAAGPAGAAETTGRGGRKGTSVLWRIPNSSREWLAARAWADTPLTGLSLWDAEPHGPTNGARAMTDHDRLSMVPVLQEAGEFVGTIC